MLLCLHCVNLKTSIHYYNNLGWPGNQSVSRMPCCIICHFNNDHAWLFLLSSLLSPHLRLDASNCDLQIHFATVAMESHQVGNKFITSDTSECKREDWNLFWMVRKRQGCSQCQQDHEAECWLQEGKAVIHKSISFRGTVVERVTSFQFLGMYIFEDLSWDLSQHIDANT